jgi:hypothetical protein
MSDEFDRLDATDKAAIAAVLNRCRVLAAKIANELRKKRPEHFVDELSLAHIHDFLERAADVLSTVKGFAGAGTSVPGPNGEDDTTRKTEQSDQASSPNEKPESATARHCPRGPACAYPAIRDGWPAGARSLGFRPFACCLSDAGLRSRRRAASRSRRGTDGLFPS